jgi:hypothetical protein
MVTMRYVLSAAFLLASTSFALAVDARVPEIDAWSGAAAIGLVGAVGALLWERRRHS